MSILDTLSKEFGYSLADIKEIGGYVLSAYGGLLGIALIRSVIDGRKAKAAAERKERREEIRERLDEIRLRLAEIRLEKAEAEIKAHEAEESSDEHEECEDRRRTQEEALAVYEELVAEEQVLEAQEQEFETIVNGIGEDEDDDGVYIYKDC